MFFLGRFVFKVISSLISLAVLAVLAAGGFVLFQSKQSSSTPTDAIVVLGASQFNGTPSPVFANRLLAAAKLYKAKSAPRIMTVGANQPGDQYTEAGAGKTFLVRNGIPAKRVIAVPTGSDTVTSMSAIADRAADRQIHTITIVSDPAHVGRAKLIAEFFGLAAEVAPTKSGPGSELSVDYLVRETLGVLYFELVARWTN